MRVQSIYQDRYIADSLQVKAKPYSCASQPRQCIPCPPTPAGPPLSSIPTRCRAAAGFGARDAAAVHSRLWVLEGTLVHIARLQLAWDGVCVDLLRVCLSLSTNLYPKVRAQAHECLMSSMPSFNWSAASSPTLRPAHHPPRLVKHAVSHKYPT